MAVKKLLYVDFSEGAVTEFAATDTVQGSTLTTFPAADKSSNYQLVADDYFINATTLGITVSLPDIALVGKVYVIKNSSSGNITVDVFDATAYIDNLGYSVILGSWESITVIKADNIWCII